MDTAFINFVYLYNPISTKNKKAEQVFTRFGRLLVIASEKHTYKYDVTANHMIDLTLEK